MQKGPDALIKFAVETAVRYINSEGLAPQDAMTKTAKELQLNPNFIKRASEAINVALTYNHLKKAEDKAADFPIVDAQKVAQDIYGGKEKTASEFISEEFSSNQNEEIAPKFVRYATDPRYKAAYEAIVQTVAPLRYEMSEGGVYEKAAHYVRNLEKAAENAKIDLAGAEYDANRAFGSILEKFARVSDYRSSFADFESQVFAKHGEAAVEYLDLLYKCSHLKEERGAHDAKHQIFKQSEEAIAFDRFLDKAAELREKTKEAEEAVHNYNFEKEYIDSIYKEYGATKTAEARNVVEELTAIDKLTKQKQNLRTMEEGNTDPVMSRVFSKKAEELDREEERIKTAFSFIDTLKDQVKSVGQPESKITTNNDFDNRNRKLILQELAVTDPILKTVDPKKLVDDYAQILHIAPELAREKEIVRATLRTMAASQSIGAYDSHQLISANNDMLKQRQLMNSKPVGQGDK